MRNLIMILALIAGLVAGMTSLKKSEYTLTGYVIADSNEMEATWHPE